MPEEIPARVVEEVKRIGGVTTGTRLDCETIAIASMTSWTCCGVAHSFFDVKKALKEHFPRSSKAIPSGSNVSTESRHAVVTQLVGLGIGLTHLY